MSMTHEYSKDIYNSRIYFEQLDISKLRCGCWINPDGILYQCHHAEHCILAHKILYVEYNYREAIEFEDNDKLIKNNWVLIQSVGFQKLLIIHYKDKCNATPKQYEIIKKLKEIYTDNNYLIHEDDLE